jgi:hypothetical protein
MRQVYDRNEALIGEGYAVSGDSFDPSELSKSCAKRYRKQYELDNYKNSMSSSGEALCVGLRSDVS